jgi:hypothetical protein
VDFGREGNNLEMEDGGLKIPIPEPVEDDSQKIQGANAQKNHTDDLLKGLKTPFYNF